MSTMYVTGKISTVKNDGKIRHGKNIDNLISFIAFSSS